MEMARKRTNNFRSEPLVLMVGQQFRVGSKIGFGNFGEVRIGE